MSVEIGTLISKDIDIRNSKVFISGTNTPVYRIVIWYKQGMTPEEIAQDCPHLTLASVYAALAYYHANKDEIETQIETENNEYTYLLQQKNTGG